jgi:small subunit ribosomal protein S17e
MELLQKYPNKFGTDFQNNKKSVNEVAIIRSKVLRNEIAGYITSHLRKQAAQESAVLDEAIEEEQEPAIEQ